MLPLNESLGRERRGHREPAADQLLRKIQLGARPEYSDRVLSSAAVREPGAARRTAR